MPAFVFGDFVQDNFPARKKGDINVVVNDFGTLLNPSSVGPSVVGNAIVIASAGAPGGGNIAPTAEQLGQDQAAQQQVTMLPMWNADP